MICSYLGFGESAKAVHRFLNNKINNYRKSNGILIPPIVLGGIYSGDLSSDSVFASENDMSAFLKADHLFDKSDIILVFLNDPALRKIASGLRGHGIRNKIIAHFSPGYNADVLDFGPENTYVSFYIPIQNSGPVQSLDNYIFLEGYGDNIEDLLLVCRMLDVDVTRITGDEKMMLMTAVSLMSTLSSTINVASQKILSCCLSNKSTSVNSFFESLINNNKNLNTYNAFEYGNSEFVYNQIDILSLNNQSDALELLGMMYRMNSKNNSDMTPSQIHIKEMADKLIKKK